MSLLLLVSLLFSENSPELLAKKFTDLFDKTCSKCHKIADLDKSLILERIGPGGGMPKGKPPLSKEEIQLVSDWLKAGAPSLSKKSNGIPEFDINYPLELEIIRIIYNDLRNLPEDEAKVTRYLTLSHLWLAGATEEELNIQRQAIQKLVNSLSWNNEIVPLIPIDKKRTIYRLNLTKLHWDYKKWELIADKYPYIMSFPNDELPNLYYKNYVYFTKTMYVRGDWFVFAASRPELYHSFIFQGAGTEPQLSLFDSPVIPEKNVIRAAIKKSGVSKNNRIIERRLTRYGAFWQSYDFDGNSDKKDIIKNPLGFAHAGGEVIFNLPNGLQAYLLTDDKGKRLDDAPINIVRDSTRPDGKITNGISCMSCHQDGLHVKYDDLLPVVNKFPDNYGKEIDKIRELYKTKDELKDIFLNDQKRYKDALEKLSVPTQVNGKEQIRIVSDKFEEDLDLKTAASELGISVGALEKIAETNKELEQIIFRLGHGGIPRDTFISEFKKLSGEILSKREKQLYTAGPYIPRNKILYEVKFDIDPRKLPPIAPVIMADGETAVVTSRSGNLTWIREGKIIHEKKLNNEIEVEPLIDQEKIIAVTKDGGIEMYDWDEKYTKATLIAHLKMEGRPNHAPLYMDGINLLYSSYNETKQESFLHRYKTKMESVSIGDVKVLSIKKIDTNKIVILTDKKLIWLDGQDFKVVASYNLPNVKKTPSIIILKKEEVVLSIGNKLYWLKEQNKNIEELAQYPTKSESATIGNTRNGEVILLKDKAEIVLVKRVDEKIEKVDFIANESVDYSHIEVLRDYEGSPAYLMQEKLEPSHFRVFTFKMKETVKITPDIGKTSEKVTFGIELKDGTKVRGGDVDFVYDSLVSRPVTFKGRESFIVTTSGGYAYVLK